MCTWLVARSRRLHCSARSRDASTRSAFALAFWLAKTLRPRTSSRCFGCSRTKISITTSSAVLNGAGRDWTSFVRRAQGSRSARRAPCAGSRRRQPPPGVRLRRLGERSISPQDRTRLLLYFLGWDQLHGARVDLLCAPLGFSEPDPLRVGR